MVASQRFHQTFQSQKKPGWVKKEGCQHRTIGYQALDAVQPSCVTAHVADTKRGAILFVYPPCQTSANCKAFVDSLRSLGPHAHVRLLHFVREPSKVTQSAYFYHRRPREQLLGDGSSGDLSMLREQGGHRVRDWSAACRLIPKWCDSSSAACSERSLPSEPSQQIIAPDPAACMATAAAVIAPQEWSYQAVLQSLNMSMGIMVEAWFAITEIVVMEANALLHFHTQGHGPIFFSVDLEHAMASFEDTFGQIFRFLGLQKSLAKSCSRYVAGRNDLSRKKAPRKQATGKQAVVSHASRFYTGDAERTEASRLLNVSSWFASSLVTANWPAAKEALRAQSERFRSVNGHRETSPHASATEQSL